MMTNRGVDKAARRVLFLLLRGEMVRSVRALRRKQLLLAPENSEGLKGRICFTPVAFFQFLAGWGRQRPLRQETPEGAFRALRRGSEISRGGPLFSEDLLTETDSFNTA